MAEGNVPEICFDVKVENTGTKEAQVTYSFTQFVMESFANFLDSFIRTIEHIIIWCKTDKICSKELKVT